MKICMIGSGYVGLVSGSCFSELGNHVICVDNNLNKIMMIIHYGAYFGHFAAYKRQSFDFSKHIALSR